MSITPNTPFNIANLEVEFSVTRDNFKFPATDGTPVYLMFKQDIVEDKSGLGERIRRVRQPDGTMVAPENKEPLYTSVVVDLQTGEECNIIVHKLLLKALQDKYTNNEYIDKILMIIRSSAKSGRGVYHTFVVKQMRIKEQPKVETPAATQTTTPTSGATQPVKQQGNGPTQQTKTPNRR